MKSRQHNGAFTKLDMLIVLGAVIVFTVFVPVYSHNARARAQRMTCASNLKQIGLSLRTWANDHRENFPWQVSTNEGGTLEFAESPDVWRHFQAASNQLIAPQILACPADRERTRTTDWARLSNTNLSYFLSLETNSSMPSRLLAGDRFVSTNTQVFSGLLVTTNWQLLRTLPGRDRHAGNVVSSDGSVFQLSTTGLRDAFSNRTVRLAIP